MSAGAIKGLLTLAAAAAMVFAGTLDLLALLSPAEGSRARESPPPPQRYGAPPPTALEGEPAPYPEDEGDLSPRGTSMRLTVPKMRRVRSVPVETAPPSADAVLDRGALHVEGTGFPWQEGSNVYIAGHRLGYPETGSHLLFFDLPVLEEGDQILLKDAGGEEYRYRVFRKLRVRPNEVRVTEPVPGKSVVSLQTCTLPDYAERLVVQAESVGDEAPAATSVVPDA